MMSRKQNGVTHARSSNLASLHANMAPPSQKWCRVCALSGPNIHNMGASEIAKINIITAVICKMTGL